MKPTRLNALLAAAGLVFKHIGFFDVGLAVFLHRWAYLSSHVVRYCEPFISMSEPQLQQWLQSRLRPLSVNSGC